jgi:hypothetical protein
VISEAHGIPLAVSLTGGNSNDVTQLMPLLAAFNIADGTVISELHRRHQQFLK